MRAGSCVESLAAAYYSALLLDLPAVEYRQWTPAMKKDGISLLEAPLVTRRPTADDIEVIHFNQTWGSTALGFGGVGGNTLTSAYTTVVACGATAAVYFAGRHAYTLLSFNAKFIEDIAACAMAPYRDAGRYTT